MVLISYSYLRLRRFARHPALRFLFGLLFIFDSLRVLSIYSHQNEASQYTPPQNTKRIYIASQHWNTASILRNYWNNALLGLVKELGPENVFVTIYESGSFDDTKGALRELDDSLGELKVKRRITLSDVSHKDEIEKAPSEHGWVKAPSGQTELRRIPFLANLRNQVLQPLEELSSQGQHFDTILFLNDVVFSVCTVRMSILYNALMSIQPKDVLALLDTNHGEYAAACSIDFSKWPYYYDTFALRDSNGHETASQRWPYFRSWTSRHATEQFRPVPVASCWNGMVAMPVEPFLGEDPLRFRGISDSLAASHLEGSECCLIHADNKFSRTKGVFLNPNVQVGYNGTAYKASHSKEALMSPLKIYTLIWRNRIIRWFTTPMFKEWVVHNRVNAWARNKQNHERGEFCLINEMQVIMEKGWKHV